MGAVSDLLSEGLSKIAASGLVLALRGANGQWRKFCLHLTDRSGILGVLFSGRTGEHDMTVRPRSTRSQ